MKTIVQLKEERAALALQGEQMLDDADQAGRALSPEETTKLDALTAQLVEMNASIAQREKLELALKPTFADEKPRTPRPQPQAHLSDDDEGEGDAKATYRRTDAGPRVEIPRSYGKLSAFAKTPKGELAAYRSGMFLLATVYGNANAKDWCRKNGVGVRAALSEGVNTAGGVLVPDEMERAIIDLREEYGLFRQAVRVRPMGSDNLIIPRRVGGLTAYFTAEGVAGTESDASWDSVQLTARKLMVLARMSSEVQEDAIIDLADTLAQEAAYAFAIKEDTVGFTGTGIGSDGGIVGVLVKAIDGNHALAKVTASGSANSCDVLTEITVDHLLDVMAAIPQYAKPGCAWYCGPVAQELVFNAIKTAAGGNTGDSLSNAAAPRFLGYPIRVSPVFPDNATTDLSAAVMLAFGNLGMAASMGDRRGIRIALSTDKYFSEDQIAVKCTERFDINVHDLGSASVKSPFAVLVGN